ncbi:C-type polyheme cytochrome OmcC [Geobacter sulfurreducens subsp. ethanolicus]|uniref:C-type polyheme cytochrome OmcC n=1 Tax=Geobacter sulfurreducens TaxID=35554 RepID=UPI002572F72F|nr:C-type polyheme cytochrome OmcC [Geobacter sulfurreducens]BEH09270.1 C-type polyheme cytochrome OmcC [Geobacter sulfurreducens subsp. ethanolicus]
MSRKVTKYSAVLAVSLFAAALAGCGSENKEGSIGTGPGGVATVGDTACVQCHSAVVDPLTGESIITQYTRSFHYSKGVGCEGCHGGGAQHNGVGPLPFPLAGQSEAQIAARCASCHNGVIAPLSSSPNFVNGNHANPFGGEEAKENLCSRCHSHEGAIFGAQAGFTGDGNILRNAAYQPVYPQDPETFNVMTCATCHQHGGAQRQVFTQISTAGVPNSRRTVAWDPNRNSINDQYDLCTSCHTVNTMTGTLIGSGNVLQIFTSNAVGSGTKSVTTAPFYHNTRWFRTLPSTHYDFPESKTTASGTTIEGYVIRRNTANPCFDCHGHEFQTNTRRLAGADRPNTIFLDWGQSAHGGKLLQAKVAAAALASSGAAEVDDVMKAGATDATAPGWTHYNWDDTASRGACQRCHTSTGASNFLNNPAGYDRTGAGNSFTHLAGWTSSNKRSDQNELLYCWGCHTKAGTGELRNPGAITEVYPGINSTSTGTTGLDVTVSYPDIKGSNVCMGCHLGREVGDNIKAITDADGILGFVNSHYLTAGGQLFGTTGYEYATRSYANPAFFQHDKIGTAAAPGTGTNGPCAGCHMTTPTSHLFLPVTKDGTGAITAITSTACVTCHAGTFALTPEGLTAEEEEYVASLEALKAALAGKGILFFNAHPYFYRDTNANGIADPGETVSSNAFTNWAGVYGLALWQDVMGAAFNANLLIHDPGGYAHNRFYSKRLIWDSIDFIFDGVLNNDVTAAIDAQVTAARLDSATATAAKAYLGATRP